LHQKALEYVISGQNNSLFYASPQTSPFSTPNIKMKVHPSPPPTPGGENPDYVYAFKI